MPLHHDGNRVRHFVLTDDERVAPRLLGSTEYDAARAREDAAFREAPVVRASVRDEAHSEPPTGTNVHARRDHAQRDDDGHAPGRARQISSDVACRNGHAVLAGLAADLPLDLPAKARRMPEHDAAAVPDLDGVTSAS